MLGDIASITTLILFVFYFVGRTITIFTVRKINFETINVSTENSNVENVEEVWYAGEDTPYSVLLTSTQGIFDIKLYKKICDEELNLIGYKIEARKDFLNIGQVLEIKTMLPDIHAAYMLEYTMIDYRKVSFELVDNMRGGAFSAIATPRHTLKSVLYYYFK